MKMACDNVQHTRDKVTLCLVYNYAKTFSHLSLIDTETVILKDCCFDSAFIIDMTVLLDVGKLQIKDLGFISGVDYCNINKF